MANSASIRTGLTALMQDHLSNRVVSLLVNTMPFMYFLLGREGNKDGAIGIGRPKTGAILSGVSVSRPKKEAILNSDKYMPIIQTTLPAQSDGKVLTQYDTMPTRANWSTLTTTGMFTRPFFKWVERVDPLFVSKKDIRRTKQAAAGEQKASAAVGDLFRAESESVLSQHLIWWNTQFWAPYTTAPSNVDAGVWDSPYSIAAALKNDNVYAGVDRSFGANAYWKGNYHSTHAAPVLEDLVNTANYTDKCQAVGMGIDLLICGLDLFPQFKSEAKAKGGTVFYDGKVPSIGEFGFKREIIKFNNTYVVMDPACPSKNGTGAATNAVAGFNLDTWTVAINPNANFEIDEPFDLTKTEGGKDAIKSQLRTELIVACEAPAVNVFWTDVG